MKIQKYIKIQVARLTDRVTGEPTCARPSEGESCYFLHDGGCIHCGRGINNNKPHRLCPVWDENATAYDDWTTPKNNFGDFGCNKDFRVLTPADIAKLATKTP